MKDMQHAAQQTTQQLNQTTQQLNQTTLALNETARDSNAKAFDGLCALISSNNAAVAGIELVGVWCCTLTLSTEKSSSSAPPPLPSVNSTQVIDITQKSVTTQVWLEMFIT